MKLIVGLGNPGKKYEHSRHNVGYLVVDELKKHDFGKNVVLARTNTFMNSSGIVVRELMRKRHVALGDLLIIHDDLDLAAGLMKLQKDRGAAGHHGVESIAAELGSADFWRLRFGIGRPLSDEIEPDDYVMRDLSKEQLEILKDSCDIAIPKVISEWAKR